MVEHYEHVRRVKAALIERLRHGRRRPGERFLSTRALADRFDVSYQTAHRLLSELVAEGWLVRRPRSGTFIPGRRRVFRGVELVFHPRCRREGSFGAHLLELLTDRLRHERIDYRINRAADPNRTRLAQDRLPIIWEQPAFVHALAERERPAIVLNDRPPLGAGSLFIDSLSTDDFGGGVLAGQLLRRHLGPRARLGVLAGPRDDARCKDRVRGLASTGPAFVAYAKGWDDEPGLAAAARLMRRRPAGVFCANDRLAEALLRWLAEHRRPAEHPPVVGFDDAPIAEQLNLTTIAIPWRAMVDATVDICHIRFADREHTPAHRILNPHPVIRSAIEPTETAAGPRPAAARAGGQPRRRAERHPRGDLPHRRQAERGASGRRSDDRAARRARGVG